MIEWIKCSEKLPQDNFGEIDSEGFLKQKCYLTYAKWIDIHTFDQYFWNRTGITHWAELPEPPKDCHD